MLAHIELRLGLVVLQIVVLQLRLLPLYGEDIICKVGIVNGAIMRQILHQVPQALPDVLKLVDSGVVQVISMQDLLDEFRLRPDLRDVCHAGHAADLLHQILPGFLIGLSNQVGKFNAIHQCIKPHGTGLVHIRLEEWGNLVPQVERILISEGLVARRVSELLYIPQVLPHSKIRPIQLLHFGEHFIYQLLSKGDQFLSLVGQILELVDNLSFQIEDGTLQGHLVGSGLAFVHAEKLEVAA